MILQTQFHSHQLQVSRAPSIVVTVSKTTSCCLDIITPDLDIELENLDPPKKTNLDHSSEIRKLALLYGTKLCHFYNFYFLIPTKNIFD